MTTCVVRDLGITDYQPVAAAMHEFTRDRGEDTPDELWFLQHRPVFTQGQAGKAEHILDPHGIPVVQSDRGGQVTYHGPGQLVVYFLLDVRKRGLGARALVDLIEASLLDTLASYGVEGHLRKGAPGVYVAERKIAALGLRIRRGCTLHGLALNIDMDLTPFTYINPCGYKDMACTRLSDLVPPDAQLFTSVRNKLEAVLQARLL